MINKERVRLGIQALRSGIYKQGFGMLRHDGPHGPEHCCLGVFTEVAKNQDSRISEYLLGLDHVGHWGDCEILPREVSDWYGFDEDDPRLPDPDHEDVPGGTWPATCANDQEGWDFNKIANAFEKLIEDDQNG